MCFLVIFRADAISSAVSISKWLLSFRCASSFLTCLSSLRILVSAVVIL